MRPEVHSKISNYKELPKDTGSLKCSCSACDSIACFARRQLKHKYSCNLDKDPLDHDVSKRSTHSISEKISTELIKNEIDYNDDCDKTENKFKNIDNIEEMSQPLFGIETSAGKDDKNMLDEKVSNKSSHHKSAAELSAQVMNVPYEHFEQSLRKSEPLFDVSTLSPFDIFTKIKEVYKACSCKVCECIVGYTQKNEFCNCKPCDCDDCKSQNVTRIVPPKMKGERKACAFTRCDRPYVCRAVTKLASPDECDCGPCECIKCVNSVSTPCNCEPCQCILCKTRNFQLHKGPGTLIVASVGEDYQMRRSCDCSPCECVSCDRGLRAAPPPMHHEMSTGLDRHPHCRCDTCANDACLPDDTNTCRCEQRNRIVRKPITSDNNDYDIRSALINQKLIHLTRNKERDTIAMFAAVNNRYRIHDVNCKCDKCECLRCSKEAANDVKILKVFKNCRASRCKHYQNNKHVHYLHDNSVKNTHKRPKLQCTRSKGCKCDMCFCINCIKIPKCSSMLQSYSEIENKCDQDYCGYDICEVTDSQRCRYKSEEELCQCAYCQCKNCTNMKSSGLTYTVKKRKQYIPKFIDSHMRDIFLEASAEIPFVDGYYLDSEQRSSVKKYQKVTSSIEAVQHKLLDIEESQDITENTRNINKGTIDFQKSPSAISVHSFSSYYDNFRDSGSILPLSRYKNNSWENSCNSSGHDYPNYLIQFPKTVVKTCFSDVINIQNDCCAPELNMATNAKPFKKPLTVTPFLCDPDINTSACTSLIENVEKSKLSYDECSAIDSEVLCSENENKSDNTPNFEKDTRRDSVENDTDKTIQDKNRFIDYNKYFEDTKKDVYEESYHDQKNRITTDCLHSEDYKRVQKTLQEAREFSQHLMLLLDKYEIANRDFVSILQKVKEPASCSKAVNIDGVNTIHSDVKQSAIIYSTIKQDNVQKKKLDIKSNNNDHILNNEKQIAIKSCGDEVTIQFKKDDNKNLSLKDSEYDFSDNECKTMTHENNLKPIMEEKEPKTTKQRVKRAKLTYNKIYRRVRVSMKPNIIPNVTATETSKALLTQDISSGKENQVKKDKVNNNLLNKADFEDLIDKSKAVAEALNTIREQNVPVPEEILVQMIKPPMEITQTKDFSPAQSPSLKKNCHVKSQQDQLLKAVYTERYPDVHYVKNKTRTVSWDSEKPAVEKYSGNKVVISNSMENLKASHLRACRLSDDKVMVEWESPRAIQFVDGYEILLDGESVKKIFNASCCRAMVPCRQTVNQLLLTVRTVTSYKTRVSHTPTTTIIYRSRENEVYLDLCERAY